MDSRAQTTRANQARKTEQNGVGLVSRIRRLPAISWIWPERHSAEAGAGGLLVVDADLPHDLSAVEASALLITIVRPQ